MIGGLDMFLENLKVRTQLAAGYGFVILLLLGITVLGIQRLYGLNADTQVIVGQRYQVIKAAFTIERDINALAPAMSTHW